MRDHPSRPPSEPNSSAHSIQKMRQRCAHSGAARRRPRAGSAVLRRARVLSREPVVGRALVMACRATSQRCSSCGRVEHRQRIGRGHTGPPVKKCRPIQSSSPTVSKGTGACDGRTLARTRRRRPQPVADARHERFVVRMCSNISTETQRSKRAAGRSKRFTSQVMTRIVAEAPRLGGASMCCAAHAKWRPP